jgi:hypothetical protein
MGLIKMEVTRADQAGAGSEGSERSAPDDFDCHTGPDGENIVINMTTAKKSRHVRSPGQLEALAKAQTARKENAVRRREEKSKPAAVPAYVHPVEEKTTKDYKAMYRAQKRELDELRFERAVHERLREVTAPAAPVVPAPAEPEKPKATIQGMMDIGWRTTGPVRKKNVMSHW